MKWWQYSIRALVLCIPSIIIGMIFCESKPLTYTEWMILWVLTIVWMDIMDIKKKLGL